MAIEPPRPPEAAKLRQRYLADAIETAAPAVPARPCCTTRWSSICAGPTSAFETDDLKAINDNLVHAQEIILTLRDTIKPELWDGAPRLDRPSTTTS